MKLSALVGVGLVAMLATACGNMGNTPAASPQSTTTLTSAPANPSTDLRVDNSDPWAAPLPPLQVTSKFDTTEDPWAPPAPAPATIGQPEQQPQPDPAAQP